MAPPLIDVFEEEPVNATKDDFGDVELPEAVTVDTAIVVEGTCGDCVLHCDDDERALAGVIECSDGEGKLVSLDPSFAGEAAELCDCAWELEASLRLVLDVAKEPGVSMKGIVVALSDSTDVVEPVKMYV